MNDRSDDGLNMAQILQAATQLARITPGDDPVAILDALRPCLRVEAGLIGVVKPGATPHATHHVLRLPPPVFEGWMNTRADHLEQSFRPVIRSNAGDFWRDTDGLPERLREEMDVLHVLDRFGLGEGAGLKILRRFVPGGGEEHVMMALLTARGERFPRQAADVCRVLAQPLQEAVLRMSLPFTTARSIHAQILEEDDVGFVCLRPSSDVIELNHRAYALVGKYCEVAGVGSGRTVIAGFVKRALEELGRGNPWQLVHPSSTTMLQVRMHVLPAEKFCLANNLSLLKLLEIPLPPIMRSNDMGDESVFRELRPREREVAMVLVTTGLNAGEIAKKLDIETRTVTTHTRNIYARLGVSSRWELAELYRARKMKKPN